jgi:hypothetical protein
MDMLTRRSFFAAMLAPLAVLPVLRHVIPSGGTPIADLCRRRMVESERRLNEEFARAFVGEIQTVVLAKCEDCGFEARVTGRDVPPFGVMQLCAPCFEKWIRRTFSAKVQYTDADFGAIRSYIARDGRPVWWFRA